MCKHDHLFPDATSPAFEPSSCTMRAYACTKAEKSTSKTQRGAEARVDCGRTKALSACCLLSRAFLTNTEYDARVSHEAWRSYHQDISDACNKVSGWEKTFALLTNALGSRACLGRGKDWRMTGGSVTSRPSPSRRSGTSHCGID